MEKAEIIYEIEEAFVEVPRPDESSIVYDDSGYHLECTQIKILLKNRRWQDIAKGAPGQHGDNLAFLTTDAFWYFLPGYMIACLQDPHGYISLEAMEVALTPTSQEDTYDGQVNDKLLVLLTPKQSKAVFHFLQYLADEFLFYFQSNRKIYRAIEFWENLATGDPGP